MLFLVGIYLAVLSCSRVERLLKGGPEPTLTPPPVPPQLRAGGGAASEPVARVTLETPEDLTPRAVEQIRDRERDLVWTDPDNPERGLQELSEVIAEGASRGPWHVSYQEARRTSMRQGKPLLVWFTDSQKSPICRVLSAEVFSQPEFNRWAEEEIVRLRLDFNVKGESRGRMTSEDDRIRKEDYLEKLKERYNVRGLPTVLLLAPDGSVSSSYRGYTRTYGDFYQSRLKNDVESALEHHEKWKKRMMRRSYREWTDRDGRTVFAKLARYSAGEMILVEPDGKRLRTRLDQLSNEDQAWIATEKAKREN